MQVRALDNNALHRFTPSLSLSLSIYRTIHYIRVCVCVCAIAYPKRLKSLLLRWNWIFSPLNLSLGAARIIIRAHICVWKTRTFNDLDFRCFASHGMNWSRDGSRLNWCKEWIRRFECKFHSHTRIPNIHEMLCNKFRLNRSGYHSIGFIWEMAWQRSKFIPTIATTHTHTSDAIFKSTGERDFFFSSRKFITKSNESVFWSFSKYFHLLITPMFPLKSNKFSTLWRSINSHVIQFNCYVVKSMTLTHHTVEPIQSRFPWNIHTHARKKHARYIHTSCSESITRKNSGINYRKREE